MSPARTPVERGGPVRAVVPGWYGTDSVKWLDRIWFTNNEFDGFFRAHDYRLRAPGEAGPGTRLTEVSVHALITTPADGETSTATMRSESASPVPSTAAQAKMATFSTSPARLRLPQAHCYRPLRAHACGPT